MILNFYLLNGIIWVIIFILYFLDYSKIYPILSIDTQLFIFFQFILSLVIAFVFQKKIKDKKVNIFRKLKLNRTIFFITFGFLLDFLYMKAIPLIDIIKKSDDSYLSFTGIPTFHVLLITFTSYYTIKIFYYFLNTFEKKYIRSFIYLIFLILLLGSRFLILGIFIPCLLLYFDGKNVGLKTVVLLIFNILLCFGLFGLFGNLRHSQRLTDYSYIKAVGAANENFEKSIIPDVYFWSYIYLTSPLANLEKNIQENTINREMNTFLFSLIPDFLQKRILYEEKSKKIQINNALNVSTSYLMPYLSYGYIGMLVHYLILNIYFMLIVFFVKGVNRKILLAIITTITLLNIFSNMFVFSALSFQIIYPILSYIFSIFKIKKVL